MLTTIFLLNKCQTPEQYYDFIENMLPGIENNSMVTPNEIDEVVENLSTILANGINMALN